MNGWRRWFARWPTAGAGVVGVNEQTRRLEEIFLSLTQNGGEAV